MKRWTKIALAAGVLAVAAGSIAWTGHGGGRGHMMKYLINGRIDEALDYIEATPQQRQIVGDVKKEIVAKMQAQHAAHQGVGAQIAALLAADSLDTPQLNALIDQKAEAMRTVGHDMVAEVAKIHASLTPAQRQKLYAKWKERHARRSQDHGNGFGGTEQ